MKNPLFLIAGLLALFLTGRAMTRPKLNHFTASEFGVWWPLMSADLLLKLDAFREQWGAPVEISRADGALGRHGGENDKSQHNIDRWGQVLAADLMPKVADGQGGYRYMQTREERNRAFAIAKAVGFTGIGIYTDTNPGNLLHVDVRKTNTERVATWSRVNKQYKGILEVLA